MSSMVSYCTLLNAAEDLNVARSIHRLMHSNMAGGGYTVRPCEHSPTCRPMLLLETMRLAEYFKQDDPEDFPPDLPIAHDKLAEVFAAEGYKPPEPDAEPQRIPLGDDFERCAMHNASHWYDLKDDVWRKMDEAGNHHPTIRVFRRKKQLIVEPPHFDIDPPI